MTEDKHLIQYILLAVGLIGIAIPFVLLAHNYTYQVYGAGATSLMFVAWGILHHLREGRLRKTIVLEYMLFGLIAFFIVFTVLNLL